MYASLHLVRFANAFSQSPRPNPFLSFHQDTDATYYVSFPVYQGGMGDLLLQDKFQEQESRQRL